MRQLLRTAPLLVAAFLSACGGNVLPDLPEGEQTIAGILQPAQLSAVRRGSHVIEQEGVNVYYAESSLVNLREYQGKRVTMRGHFEHNTDSQDLPVLVVETIVDVEETTKEHTLTPLRVRFAAPVHWSTVERDGKYQFRIDGESEDPLLVIWEDNSSELPEGGVPIVVDATRATRLVDETSNTQIVAVKREGTVLNFRFSPGKRLSAERLLSDFLQLLKSVELLSAATPPPVTGTGSLGSPCGGAAGILCPSGYFCDIQDFEENIGRCRRQ